MMNTTGYKLLDEHEYADEAKFSGHLTTWQSYVLTRKQLESWGPYRFFMTLSFQYELSDKEGQEVLAKVWRRLMKKVLGKRWIKKGIKPLTGIVVLERAQLFAQSTREFGSCHFHLLVHEHPRLPKNDIFAAIKLLQAFIDAAKQMTHPNRRWQLVSKHGVNLKVIRPGESASFAKYVAKEAVRHDWKWDERVFFLGKNGI